MAEGYHDFTAGEVLTAANLEDYCGKQAVMRFASAAAAATALSAVKTEGMCVFLLDTNCLGVYNASAATISSIGPVHGALTTWTPVVVQGATPTLTNNGSFYTRTGRWIQGRFLVTTTSAGTVANLVTISLPFTASTSDANTKLGNGSIFDTSAGFDYTAMLVLNSTTTMKYQRQDLGPSAPGYLGLSSFTSALASTDVLAGTFAFECASDA